jgi:hypothetical protein
MGAVIPAFSGSGNTIYGQISDGAGALMWNGATMEAYNQTHWATYTVAMTEQPLSGRYIMTVPGGLAAGRYFVSVYLQAGASPAVGVDTPIDFVFFDWDGGSAIGLGSSMNVGKINGSAPAAVALGVSALQFVTGAAAAGTLTPTQMTTGLVATVANIYSGRTMLFTSGVNLGLTVLITGYRVAGGMLTFVAYNNLPAPAAPGLGDTFIVI